MKILLFARDYAPQIGGVQNMLSGLMNTFDPEDITVIARDCSGSREFDQRVKYQIIRMPSLENLPKAISILLRAVLSLFYVFRQMITNKPDLMLCGYAKGNGPFGWVAKKIFGVPYVVFAYGTDVLRYRGKKSLARKWLAQADLVAAISEPVHKFVEEYTQGKAKVVTVPLGCGVTGEAPKPYLSKWQDIELADKKVVLTVCRLTPRKGVDKTIQAVSLLKEKYPDMVYIIVGQGDDNARLVNIAKESDVEQNIIFAGRVSDDDLLRFYQRADIFILASREEKGDIEGFGLVFVEAGAFSVPVIGGDSGGIKEAVAHEENGLLVDSTSPEAIAEAIERLLLDKDLSKRLGKHGLRRSREVFTWENCKKTMLDALKV